MHRQLIKTPRFFGMWRLIQLVTAAALALAPLGFDAGRPALAATNRGTLTVDASSNTGAFAPRYEGHFAQIHTTKGSKDQALLRDLRAQYARGFLRVHHISTAEGQYNFSYDNAFSLFDKMFRDIRAYGAKPIVTIAGMPEWLADTGGKNYGDSAPDFPPRDYAKYEQMLYDVLKYYKRTYPEMEFVEYWNEPDLNANYIAPETYNKMYAAAVKALQRVNTDLKPAVPLRIGGPTLKEFNASRLENFLAYAAQNRLPVDFLSWHEYHHDAQPAYLETEAKTARQLLQKYGYPSAKLFVTEWAYTSQSSSQQVSSANTLRDAAFAVTGMYYWRRGGLDVANVFALQDYVNPNRSVLAPGRWTSTVTAANTDTDGVPMPLYNMLRMTAMLKANQLAVTTDALDTKTGRGVNVIATSDAGGLALLIWNYQGGYANSYDLTVQVNNLPANYQGRLINLQRYLVDEQTSNYLANSQKAGLTLVDSRSVSAQGAGLSLSLTLNANAASLIVLTPGAASATPTLTPTAQPSTSPIPPTASPAPTQPPAATPLPTQPPTATPPPAPTQPPQEPGLVVNAVRNGGFEAGTAEWTAWFNPNGGGAADFTTGADRVEGAQAGQFTIQTLPSDLNVQVYQAGLALEPNRTYVLSFAAKSSGGRDLALSLIQHGAPFTNYGLDKKAVDLTGEWRTYTLAFTTANFTTPVTDARLMFFLGQHAAAGDTYFIDDVFLAPIVVNAVRNGGFEAGTAEWTAWASPKKGGVAAFTTGMDRVEGAQAGQFAIQTLPSDLNVQLNQAGLALEPNRTYVLSFAAKSSGGHDLTVSLLKHSAPFTNYGLSKTVVDLTGEWRSYTFTFTTANFTTPVTDARLMFFLGQHAAAGDTYYLDNVLLAPLP